MGKQNKINTIISIIGACGILCLCGFYFFGNSKEVSFTLSQFRSPLIDKKRKVQYEKAWSEQIALEDLVKPYETYLINWTSTYVGKVGVSSQNTTSLKYDSMEKKGAYKDLDTVFSEYPNLKGVITEVEIRYSYDTDTKTLFQMVKLRKVGLDAPRVATITYDNTGSVQDYSVWGFEERGGYHP